MLWDMHVYRRTPDARELLKDPEIKTCNLQVQVLGEQHTDLQSKMIYVYLTKQLLFAQSMEQGAQIGGVHIVKICRTCTQYRYV